MRQIRFRFDAEKLVQALAFFASKGVENLDAMKAAKLLYFADKLHLQKYGRPIIGDDYYCMKHGPIPTISLNLIKAMMSGATEEVDGAEMLAEYFDVTNAGKYPELLAKKGPDLDVFSDSDVEVLAETISMYGGKTAWQLRDIAHQQPDVAAADKQRLTSGKGSVPMPFESFLYDPAHKALIALIEEDQENRDFANSLTW